MPMSNLVTQPIGRILTSPWSLLGLSLVLSFVLYWPTLEAYALGDDVILMLHGPDDRMFWESMHGDWFGRLSRSGTRFYRPAVALSFRLEYLLWEMWTPGSHATNVLTHAFVSWLVVMLVWQLRPERAWRWAGLLAGMVFLFHPRHCEAVAPLCSRPDIFCTLGILGGGVLHALAWRATRARALGFRVGAVAAYGFA